MSEEGSAIFGEALEQYNKGHWQVAEPLFRTGISSDPNNALARFWHAKSLTQKLLALTIAA
jgi:hypothetical protein